MPRHARLDAPDTLQHVMVRGIERTAIFRDDTDRADFVARVAALAQAGAWAVLAWALLPTHAHLLVRTGSRPLARSMRSLLTGYAGAFNRRHHRAGHLFQNRYKSIVVEAEPYLLELVRYLHLNPLRAQCVPDLRTLDRYPWTGHSALLGMRGQPWQATAEILAQFGPTRDRARRAYRAFVAAGIAQGRRPDLQGGGLVRSLGGWAAVAALRRGREAGASDERVLGRPGYVEQLRQTLPPLLGPARVPALPALLAALSARLALPVPVLQGRSRARTAVRARQLLAYLWVEQWGQRASELARTLGQTRGNISLAAQRGARLPEAAAVVRWAKKQYDL
jgi:putative transposase